MKRFLLLTLLLLLAALAAACAAQNVATQTDVTQTAAAQADAAQTPATQPVAAQSAAAPGLPNTCAVSGACPAASCGVLRGEACTEPACPYAGACTAEDGCAADPYNACVDEPACGDVEEAETSGGGCLVSYDMLHAATVGIYQKLTQAEAKARMDSGDPVVILDVRTQAEYEAGHIPGAILLPNESITDAPPEQLSDASAEILVYCRSGRRSKEAVEKLAALGYTNVYDFGGINDWPYETVAGGEKTA